MFLLHIQMVGTFPWLCQQSDLLILEHWYKWIFIPMAMGLSPGKPEVLHFGPAVITALLYTVISLQRLHQTHWRAHQNAE